MGHRPGPIRYPGPRPGRENRTAHTHSVPGAPRAEILAGHPGRGDRCRISWRTSTPADPWTGRDDVHDLSQLRHAPVG